MKQFANGRFLTVLITATLLSCWTMIGCSNKDDGGDSASVGVSPEVLVVGEMTGHADEQFSGKGYVVNHNAAGGDYHDFGKDVAIDQKNRIVVTGASFKSRQFDSYPCMVVWRYKEDGSPDTSFSGQGRVSFCDNSNSNDPQVLGAAGHSVLVDAKGRIVVAGKIYVKDENNEYIKDIGAVWRYTAEGRLDLSFNNGEGLLTHSEDADQNVSFEDSILYNDNILITGEIAYYQTSVCPSNDDHCVSKGAWIPRMGVWLYDGESGAPVSNFRTPGSEMALAMKMHSSGKTVSYDSEGRILVAGYSIPYYIPVDSLDLEKIADLESRDAVLWRFDSKGNLDAEFGDKGWVTHDLYDRNKEDALFSVTPARDGSILVAGRANRNRSTTQEVDNHKKDAIIIKYDSKGKIKHEEFGNQQGVMVGNQGLRKELINEFTSMVVDYKGRILVAGSVKQKSSSQCGENYDMFVERYTSAGYVDIVDFGKMGHVVYRSSDSSSDYTSSSCEDDFAVSIALDKRGKAVVTGYIYNGSDYDMVIWRVK